MELIIALLSGAAGGNIAGALLKNYNMGTLLNSIAGIVGGGLGGSILSMLGAGGVAEAAGSGLDLGSIIGSVASGGVGGGVLMVIAGLVKQALAR
jgi:uncharacterized membrane protein YeaQ/YmgE (transglycosylase-associated protein family)